MDKSLRKCNIDHINCIEFISFRIFNINYITIYNFYVSGNLILAV